MGFEKGNIQFIPLHKYNYYSHRWQSYLNIKSESEKMWVTGLEVARAGRWKHRCARGTGRRMDRAEPLIGLWLHSHSEKGPQDNRPLFSERGKGMLNAQEQKSFRSSEFLQRKEQASFAKETVYSCVFWLHRCASLYCASQGLCCCLTDWTSLTTLSQASRRTPFFQQRWLTSLSRFGNSLTIPDFFIIFLLSVSVITHLQDYDYSLLRIQMMVSLF